MRRILFVDDEQHVLDGLRRMLRSQRHEWVVQFAQGGAAALDELEHSPFDVVVTDMRMPGIDGAELLARVRDRYPRIVRIVLSGEGNSDALVRSVSIAHQFLSKPCDTDLLKETVARACALQDLLANDSVQRTVSRIESIPCLPALYNEIVQELQSAEPSAHKVGQIISQDPGMTSKVLQMVNSSFFGIRRHISSPSQAALLLGTESIKALVLSTHVFTQFAQPVVRELSIESICAHSNKTGALARKIAELENADRKIVDYAFMAGLLHDTGKLVLATHFCEEYRQAMAYAVAENMPLVDAERRAVGVSHAEVGAYLLGLWGLPHPVVESVAWHHRPIDCPGNGFCALTAVYAANLLEQQYDPAQSHAITPIDESYLARIGVAERLGDWHALARAQQES